MIYVLGVDPGRPSGWAIVKAPDAGEVELHAYGQTKKLPADIDRVSRCYVNLQAKRTEDEIDPCYAAIESQFIPSQGGKGGNERHKAVSILKTAKTAGRWEQAAEAHGWTLYHEGSKREGVLAGTWRTALGGPYRQTAEMWEVWARDQVKLRYGLELKKTWHHAADAILIATWSANRIRMEQRTA